MNIFIVSLARQNKKVKNSLKIEEEYQIWCFSFFTPGMEWINTFTVVHLQKSKISPRSITSEGLFSSLRLAIG